MKIFKYILFLFLIFIGVYILSSFTQHGTPSKESGELYRKITPKEALEMMENGDHLLLDVRSESEFWEIRIDGATLIPDSEISARAQAEIPDKDTTILIYCRSGRRSKNAALELIEMGYTNVYDFGGIIDWPYETVEGK